MYRINLERLRLPHIAIMCPSRPVSSNRFCSVSWKVQKKFARVRGACFKSARFHFKVDWSETIQAERKFILFLKQNVLLYNRSTWTSRLVEPVSGGEEFNPLAVIRTLFSGELRFAPSATIVGCNQGRSSEKRQVKLNISASSRLCLRKLHVKPL